MGTTLSRMARPDRRGVQPRRRPAALRPVIASPTCSAAEPLKDILSPSVARPPAAPVAHRPAHRVLDLGLHPRPPRWSWFVLGAATHLVVLGVLTAIPTVAGRRVGWSDTSGAEPAGRPRARRRQHDRARVPATLCRGVQRVRGRHWRWRGPSASPVPPPPPSAATWVATCCRPWVSVIHHTAFRAAPSEWTPRHHRTGGSMQGSLCVSSWAYVPVIVLLLPTASLVALDAHCPHRGVPMAEGYGRLRDGARLPGGRESSPPPGRRVGFKVRR